MLKNDLVEIQSLPEHRGDVAFAPYSYLVILYPNDGNQEDLPTSFSLGAMWNAVLENRIIKKHITPPVWRYMALDGTSLLKNDDPRRLEIYFKNWCTLVVFVQYVLRDEFYPNHTIEFTFRELCEFLQKPHD